MSEHQAIQEHKAKNYMSEGIRLSNVCLYCGKHKSGKSHPKCSRMLQKMKREGKI